MTARIQFAVLIDELERYELPHRIRREPAPEKKPPRPNVKPRFAEVVAGVEFAAAACGVIANVGGDDAKALMVQAKTEGCRTAIAIAEWLNTRGYRGRMGGLWCKQSVVRVSGRNQADFDARMAEHTASIRAGLREAKAAGTHSRDRAHYLNDRQLLTLHGCVWTPKTIARWWKSHGSV